MKYKIHFKILSLLLIICINSFAQFSITFNFKNITDTVVYFRIKTFNEKLFLSKDTIKITDQKKTIQFSDKIYGGDYFLYFPESKKKISLYIDNMDKFNITIDGKFWDDSIFCSDKKNNLYIKYQLLENKFKNLDSQYNELQKRGAGSLKTKELLYKTKKDSLSSFRANAIAKADKKGLLFKYFNTLNSLDAYSPNKSDYLGREKFINSFSLNDIQLYFSPLLKDIIYEYLSSFPLQADSMLKGIKVVMGKLNCKDKAYPNTFDYIASVLQNSSIKDNLKGYTSFIESYLIKSSCRFLPKRSEDEFMSNYNKIKTLTITDTAANIILKDTSGNIQTLYDQLANYDYTLISFFDPTCEHCKYQIPQVDSAVSSLRKQTGSKILNFAICNTASAMQEEWKKFIIEKHLAEDYIHVILGEESQTRNAYAAYSNPMFFLCNNKGLMLLKKTNISDIKKLILQQQLKTKN